VQVRPALSVIGPDEGHSGGAVGLTERGSGAERAGLERERHRRTRVGQVEDVGDARVLIETSKAAARLSEAPFPKRARFTGTGSTPSTTLQK
jgi:hypothetical protein